MLSSGLQWLRETHPVSGKFALKIHSLAVRSTSLSLTLLVVSLSQNTRSHSCRHRLTKTSTGLILIFPSTARVPPRSVIVVLGVSSMPYNFAGLVEFTCR